MAMEESADAEPPPPPPVTNGNGHQEESNDAPPPLAAEMPAPVKPFSSWPVDALTKEIKSYKTILENAEAAEADLVGALKKLRAGGDVPTKVLSETMIGKSVNNIAKSHPKDAVKREARALVEDWRKVHRKRKASAAGMSGDLDKSRTFSTASMDSDPVASPPSLEKSASLVSMASMDSLAGSAAEASNEKPAAEAVDTAAAVEKPEITARREKVRQKLLDALGKEETIETKAGEDSQDQARDPVALAAEIEESLHTSLTEKEYFNQARAVIFNLKDKKNMTFRMKLMVGFFAVKDVAKLSAEDMASDDKNKERQALRKFAMEEIQSDWAIKRGAGISGLFTCGKCKGMKTTYFQMQTRSSDEPMTTFVSCLECGNRWKFC